MKKIRNCMLTSLALLAFVVPAAAQDAVSRDSSRTAGPAVTISVTEGGVRFAALGSFGKMRLEVFNADSVSLYNSDFRAANVQDWTLNDKDGAQLADGTYLCVVTLRDLSGRLSTKQGSVVVKGGQPSLQMTDAVETSVVAPDKSLAPMIDHTPLTAIGNDGNNGQLINSQGALTFRFGDFFAGKDKEVMRLTESGNLGIGTDKPQAKLDVAGAIRAQQGLVFNDGSTLNVTDKGALTLTNGSGTITPNIAGTGTLNMIAKWTPDSSTLGNSGIIETNSGFVGIGTPSPDSLINVEGTIPAFGGHMAVIRTTGTNNGSGLLLDASGSGNNNLALGVSGVRKAALSWDNARHFLGFLNIEYSVNDFSLRLNADGSLTFNDGASSAERLRITTGGNVGIGTPNPQSPLDVNGNINVTGNATVSGNIAAKYQDIAEWTSGPSGLPSGSVVSLDALKPNSVMASNKAYDTRVAGVVSAQPGVILGEGGPNRVLVATTGRVKVRVSADRGPIHIGDLLVTSDTSGVAMKSMPFRVNGKRMHRPGTIIGKALEPLAKGNGTILVLLSLQ
jgi:hypothetical protein